MMINDKLNNLLLRSFDEDLRPQERETLEMALADSEELRDEKRKLEEMRKIVSSNQYSFSPGFKEKVMSKVYEEKEPLILRPEFNRSLFTVFKRVALTGVAAIIILFLSIYLTDGSFTFNSLTGGDPYSDDNLVSYLLYEDLN